MIEGTLKDTSLPGLLQFLATETNKFYKLKLTTGGQTGEIYINGGHIVSATFNLLDGEDALCEFLSWRHAIFAAERLAAEFESTIKKNINLRLQSPTTFVAQSAFLIESNVGLNTTIVASKRFGSLDWQDAMRRQPLEKDDFVVLGWLKDGRTLRQAAREFGFDIVQATSVLYRLLLTHSVEIVRTGTEEESQFVTADSLPFPLKDIEQVIPVVEEEKNNTSVKSSEAVKATVDLSEVHASLGRLKKGAQVPHKVKSSRTNVVVPAAALAGMGIYQAVAAASAPAVVLSEPEALEKEDKSKVATIDCAPDVIAPAPASSDKEEESTFSARRTEALPLVTIDIERLLQATFTITHFGKLALNNEALEQHLRQTLLDVESGKGLHHAINSSVRTPSTVLSTYRFCLARGYIISSDPVIPLTADLLLARIELDQYLLQRRRINGDELRDLIEIQRQTGVKLIDLLVRNGYLTASDLTRLTAEQKRFALK